MTGVITPRGYLNVFEAARILAGVPNYSADDDENLDTADRIDDAVATDTATRELRQRLCDGELTAHFQTDAGEIADVHKWIWADDKACLSLVRSCEPETRNLQCFVWDGIKIAGIRSQVYLREKEFDAFRKGGNKGKDLQFEKGPRRRGRPKGSSPIDDNDEKFLLLMDPMIKDGDHIMTAADSVVFDHRDEVWRDPASKTTDENVSRRLQRKWSKTRRQSSD